MADTQTDQVPSTVPGTAQPAGVPDTPQRIPPPPKAKVHLGVPVMDRPHLSFMNSMFRAMTTSVRCQVQVSWNQQDSLIERSRNFLFSDWLLRSDEEYFAFLDSDLELCNNSPGDNLFDYMYDDLQQPGVDFVGGLYSVKSLGKEPRSASVGIDFGPPPKWNTGLHEMLWLSTGCWMMRRKVGEALLRAHPELIYDGDGGAAGKKMLGIFNIFIADIKPGDLPGVNQPIRKLLSEDWAFCQRYRSLGGRIWNDSRIVLKHWGAHPYSLYNEQPKPGCACSGGCK